MNDNVDNTPHEVRVRPVPREHPHLAKLARALIRLAQQETLAETDAVDTKTAPPANRRGKSREEAA